MNNKIIGRIYLDDYEEIYFENETVKIKNNKEKSIQTKNILKILQLQITHRGLLEMKNGLLDMMIRMITIYVLIMLLVMI